MRRDEDDALSIACSLCQLFSSVSVQRNDRRIYHTWYSATYPAGDAASQIVNVG